MDSISPIHEFEDNPFVGVITGKPLEGSHEAPPVVVHGKTIDPARMAKDPAYYVSMMKWFYEKAKAYYNGFQYAYAQELYQQFFKYIRFYRPTQQGFPPGINFYPALFEFSWLLQIQNQRTEAQKLLNQELAHLLETSMKSQEPKLQPFKEQVQALQAEGRFPAAGHPTVEVTPEDLLRLAQQASALDAQLAAHLARHAEVRQQLGLSRTQQMIQKWEQREETIAKPQAYAMLPFGFSHTGVPISPLPPPLTTEDIQAVQTKILEPEYHVDKVEPVYGLNKDPREQNKRGRRQRKTNTSSRRNKSGRGPRPPRITL